MTVISVAETRPVVTSARSLLSTMLGIVRGHLALPALRLARAAGPIASLSSPLARAPTIILHRNIASSLALRFPAAKAKATTRKTTTGAKRTIAKKPTTKKAATKKTVVKPKKTAKPKKVVKKRVAKKPGM